MDYYSGISYEVKKFYNNLPQGNYLFSYYNDPKTWELLNEAKIAPNIKIMVDSGAFTLQKKGSDDDKLRKYISKYKRFIKQTTDDPRTTCYFEMDIDEHIGYRNVLSIREELFSVSPKIVPVWHHTLGIHEFKKMVKDYDYVSISCVQNKDIPLKQLPFFVKYAHKHKTKIHGLGMTRKSVLDKVPFDSVDSTSWKSSVIWGRQNGGRLNEKMIPSSWKIKKENTSNQNTRMELFRCALLEDIIRQKHYKKYWEWYKY